MSIIDDFAAINKAMHKDDKRREAVPVTSTECLCHGMGWIAVRGLKTTWKGIECPECKNPAGKPSPL